MAPSPFWKDAFKTILLVLNAYNKHTWEYVNCINTKLRRQAYNSWHLYKRSYVHKHKWSTHCKSSWYIGLDNYKYVYRLVQYRSNLGTVLSKLLVQYSSYLGAVLSKLLVQYSSYLGAVLTNLLVQYSLHNLGI